MRLHGIGERTSLVALCERGDVGWRDARRGRTAVIWRHAAFTPASGSRGPPGDSRNNPCRRQGDQVVAPSSTGSGWWLGTTMAPPAGRRYRAPRLRGGGRRRSVVLSQGARARMGVPVGEGSARRRLGRSRDGRPRARFAPAFARGCGRPHTPGRRARVSSNSIASDASIEQRQDRRFRSQSRSALSARDAVGVRDARWRVGRCADMSESTRAWLLLLERAHDDHAGMNEANIA
jgi:hypothetical protein